MPASTFKAELARILAEQGYIEDYEVEPARVGRTLRVKLKYTEDRKPVILGHRAPVQAGPAPVRRASRGPQDLRRHGHHDRLDLPGRHDRPRRAPRRASAASSSRRSGSSMSRIGKQPIAVPDGVEITIEPELVNVKGPKGELEERVSRDIGVAQENGEIVVTRSTDRGEHRALHGLTRSLIANMVEGVTSGFEKRLEIQGVGYRAQLQGNKIVLGARLLAPGRGRTRPRASSSRCPQPTQIIVRGHLQAGRRRDRRAHPQAAPAGALQGQGHPLRGRARGPEGRQARMSPVKTKPQARLRRRRRVRAKVHGTAERPRLSVFRSNRGIQAQLIDDVQGHTVAAVNLDRGRPQGAGPHGAGQARRRAAGAAAPRTPASRSACSIAAATATTAASRRWPTARARAG